jgi:hypothetical protein
VSSHEQLTLTLQFCQRAAKQSRLRRVEECFWLVKKYQRVLRS